MNLEPLLLVNGLANFAISLSTTLFFLMVFGREDGIVQKWKAINHWLLKLGLITIASSAAWNAISSARMVTQVIYIPIPAGEVITNVALACIFSWAFWFHKFHFLKVMEEHKRKTTPVRKKRVARKPVVKK